MRHPDPTSPVRSRLLQFVAPMVALLGTCAAQGDGGAEGANRQDQLRGSITPEREWWDVLHYDLSLQVFPDTKSLKGSNRIAFKTLKAGQRMQVDLQPPLAITRVAHGDVDLPFEREGKVYWVQFGKPLAAGVEDGIEVFYEGKPVQSRRPPWSGGLSWDKDDKGNPFIATTCQGIGASIWWPNKDHGYDEPDRGMDIRVTVPEALTAVSNGRLQATDHDAAAHTKTFHWQVTNPINNYGVNLNIGNYVAMQSVYDGEGGKLDVEYWMLEHQQEKARQHFKEAPRTLAAFEHWFGKYPFYEDSYKLVVVPYLGMEHQSSVTYGNGFQNGYRGRDLSETGVGMKFDFIIVHESAHEWWGNNISMRDAADMWIHESFANYAENLFVEYHFTAKEAQDYVIGCRKLILNDRPIIGTYGVNRSGSGDMYYKGGNMLHTMRHIVNDDAKWRSVLRGLNREFWHKTIGTAEFEGYLSRETGFDFGRFFDQYLRTTKIPVLKYRAGGGSLSVWWDNVVPGFAVPVVVRINGKEQRITVAEKPAKIALGAKLESFELDRNFYMTVEASGTPPGTPSQRRTWTPLFNGRDLSGWTPKIKGYAAGENFGDTFRVVDGLLTVAYDAYQTFDARFGHLFYASEFSNYRLRAEYRFLGEQVKGGPGWALRNSGLMIHGQPVATMGKDQDFPASIEVQLLGGGETGERPTANLCTPGTNVVRNGELWTQHCLDSTSPTFRGDGWVTVEVEVRGDTIRHRIGGDTVLSYDAPQLDPRDADAKRLLADGRDKLLHRGTISLQSESHPVQFRTVEILELDPPGEWVEPLAASDLSAHCTTKGNWTLTDGVARLAPRPGEAGWQRYDHYLWLAGDYAEFEAEFEYRLEAGGNSGFYFHVGDRATPVATGVEVQIFDTPKDRARLTDHDSGGIIPGGPPAANAARPAGEWNHMHVLCEDGMIQVTLNGRLVHTMSLDHDAIADRPRTGAIGFQDHSMPIELRGWRVRSLDGK